MEQKSKLFIAGRISEIEVALINHEFLNNEFDIVKYSQSGATISGIHDVVRLIFDDFNPISFARDILLGKLVEISLSKIFVVVKGLMRREKVITEIVILKRYYKLDGGVIFIKFHARPEKFNILIREVSINLSFDFFEGIQSGKNISVGLDYDDQLKILVL